MSGKCHNLILTGEKRTRTDKYLQRIDCGVLVFNADSKGVCLSEDSKGVHFVRGIHSVKAKLSMQTNSSMFSKKTKNSDDTSDHRIYIPD